jgi:hypothetical protein
VEHICQYLEGDRLRAVWQGLDDLQKTAVAEVVHSPGAVFPAERFRAKYGRLADFGTLSLGSRDRRPSALRLFFLRCHRPWRQPQPDDVKDRLGA